MRKYAPLYILIVLIVIAIIYGAVTSVTSPDSNTDSANQNTTSYESDDRDVSVDRDEMDEDMPSVCVVSGCNGEVCSDEEVMSACVYRPVFSCFKDAVCERQDDGDCGWTETDELRSCLASFEDDITIELQ